jgi:hypothetical protein
VGCVVTVNGGRGVLVDVPADGNAWSDAWWWIIILINLVNPVKLLLPLLILWSFARTTSAHEGPPFALFVDQKVDRYIVSVWTDPDVGTAQFFVIINTPNLPPDLRVQIGVQPTSNRLPEAVYTAQRENLQNQVQYRADVHFDAQELWRIRVKLESAQGSGETVATVEATPPGYGRWDLLLYLVPFLAVGLLWAIAMVRKMKRST